MQLDQYINYQIQIFIHKLMKMIQNVFYNQILSISVKFTNTYFLLIILKMSCNYLSKNSLELSHSKPTFLMMNHTLKKLKIDPRDFYQKAHSTQIHQNIFSKDILATISYPKGLIINQMKYFSKRKQEFCEREDTGRTKSRSNAIFNGQQNNCNLNKGFGRIKNRKAISQLSAIKQQVQLPKQFQSNFSMNSSALKKEENTLDQLRKSQQKRGFIVSRTTSPQFAKSVEKQQNNPIEMIKIKRATTFVKSNKGNHNQNQQINDILFHRDNPSMKKDRILNMFKMEVIEYEEPIKYATISCENDRNKGFSRFKDKNRTAKNCKKLIDKSIQFPYPFNEYIQKQHGYLDDNFVRNPETQNKTVRIMRQKHPVRSKKRNDPVHILQTIEPIVEILKLNQKHKNIRVEKTFAEKMPQTTENKVGKQVKKSQKKIQQDLFLIQSLCGWQSRQNAVNFGDQLLIE